MLLIAGIIPIADLPLIEGKVEKNGGFLSVNGNDIPPTQGTAAMISAALEVSSFLDIEPPHVVLAGDIGNGKGSRLIYRYLIENLESLSARVLALHYCLPIIQLMKQLVAVVDKCGTRPVLIADAASMYAAKAAGLAGKFDIFTPDASEIAFLADPEAEHPAYISRHLFETDSSRVPELIKKAYANNAAARLLLVKGECDYIALEGNIIASVNEPDIPEIECIGGTGDTITGMLSAFVHAGYPMEQAALISARANRFAGQMAEANPATLVGELIRYLPEVFKDKLDSWVEKT
jgi:NAD(P)H-hydrate repair Nnr-like enzyme with NAD(P)H-hydrate dehydratase domain